MFFDFQLFWFLVRSCDNMHAHGLPIVERLLPTLLGTSRSTEQLRVNVCQGIGLPGGETEVVKTSRKILQVQMAIQNTSNGSYQESELAGDVVELDGSPWMLKRCRRRVSERRDPFLLPCVLQSHPLCGQAKYWRSPMSLA